MDCGLGVLVGCEVHQEVGCQVEEYHFAWNCCCSCCPVRHTRICENSKRKLTNGVALCTFDARCCCLFKRNGPGRGTCFKELGIGWLWWQDDWREVGCVRLGCTGYKELMSGNHVVLNQAWYKIELRKMRRVRQRDKLEMSETTSNNLAINLSRVILQRIAMVLDNRYNFR